MAQDAKILELGWSWCNLASDIKFLFTTLDVYHLCFRLFPEPLLRSLKSGNSPSAQTARIFTFTPQMLFFGNNLRLDGTHLRLDELFAVGRYLALLPFQSNGVLATLRILVHYKILGRPLSGTTSLPEWGCACYAAFLCSFTAFFVGRCLALLPFQSNGVLATLRILVHFA